MAFCTRLAIKPRGLYVMASVERYDMTIYKCLFVLPLVVQVLSQGPPHPGHPGFQDGRPHKCAGPPPDIEKPQDCCDATPIYTEADFSECGLAEDDLKPRNGPPNCEKQLCLLQKKGLADGVNINYDAINSFMDEWATKNEAFKPSVEKVRELCLGEGGPPGPPRICEANRLMFCMGGTMFASCPEEKWLKTDECTRLKQHMIECQLGV